MFFMFPIFSKTEFFSRLNFENQPLVKRVMYLKYKYHFHNANNKVQAIKAYELNVPLQLEYIYSQSPKPCSKENTFTSPIF